MISRSDITLPKERARRSHLWGHFTYNGQTGRTWKGVRGTAAGMNLAAV